MTLIEKTGLQIKSQLDITFFLKEFFPNHFAKDFAPFHIEMFEFLKKYPRVAIAAPRKHGKTQNVGFGWVMWNLLCNPQNHFTVILSNNYANAVKYLVPIKEELEHNEHLIDVYGRLKSDKWSEDEIDITAKKKIICGGNDFKIRGQKYMQYRPDLLILDDPEDDEMVRSKERRDNFEHYILYALEPAMCMGKNQIIYIDTVKHRDSQLSKFLTKDGKYADWEAFKYQAWVKENEIPLWDEFEGSRENTILWLQREKSKDPYKFSQEYMNNPIPYEHAMFKEEYFDNYTEEQLPKDLLINVTVDLACTDKSYSDYTVIMPVGIDWLGDLWVLPYIRGKYVDPDEIINQMFAIHKKYSDSGNPGWVFGRFGVEKVAFQRFLIKNFDRERKKRGLHFPISELDAKGDKVMRISQLQPFFASGDIHIRSNMLDLKEELLDFPKARHDDTSESLSMHLNFITRKPSIKTASVQKWCVTPEKQMAKIMRTRVIKPKIYARF